MLQRYEFDEFGGEYEYSEGEYIRYDDVKKLIELNKKLLGRHSYTPNDIQNGVDFYDVEEILQDLETEIMEVLED